MKKLLTFIFSLVFLFSISTSLIFAATNYGDGTYGGGNYNVGDTPVPAATSEPSSNTASAPQCNDTASTGLPDLFEIHTTKNSATLYFAPPTMPYSNFYIAFSRKTDIWEYGTQYDQSYSGGALKITINSLSPNTKYYFKIRSGNGCATGNWGNIMAATTTNSKTQKTYYKNIFTAIVQKVKNIINKIIPSKTDTQIPTATVNPAITTETPNTPAPVPTEAPRKFCILWWCF